MTRAITIAVLIQLGIFALAGTIGYMGKRISALEPCYDTAIAWQLRTKIADQMDALMNSNSEDTEAFTEYAKLLHKVDSIADQQSEKCLNP